MDVIAVIVAVAATVDAEAVETPATWICGMTIGTQEEQAV